MKLRIMGTSEEVKQLAELLPAIMNVSNVSGAYSNRASNDAMVCVDGVVEKGPYTEAMKKYAAIRNQLEGLFMVAVTSAGEFMQANTATTGKGFLSMMCYLSSEDFAKKLEEDMENFLKGKTHKESEASKNAC